MPILTLNPRTSEQPGGTLFSTMPGGANVLSSSMHVAIKYMCSNHEISARTLPALNNNTELLARSAFDSPPDYF